MFDVLLDPDHAKIRDGLFGTSKGKRTSGNTKIVHQRALADLIWDVDEEDGERRKSYRAHKDHYVKALGNHLTG